MSNYKIPFNKPPLVGKEIQYIVQAILQGHASGDGPFTAKCSRLLEEVLNIPKVLLTTSCTHALEMSALLLDIQPGDEVIVPSFTFVTTINSFVLRGARPVFIDIRPDTLNMDEKRLETLITPRTKAIIVVHYAGIGCEMDIICKIAEKHGVPVVEDNAHGLFAQYRERWLGSFGQLATLSFHETKNFICGEGGALLINDTRYLDRAEIIREKGTNRSNFFRGMVDKYTWVDIGSSYLPSDILAAFLLAQLESRDQILKDRKRVFETYKYRLTEWAGNSGVCLPTIPACCKQAYHMFYILLPTETIRRSVINHLKENSISSVFHYLPLHLSPMGRKFGYTEGDCPVTENISDRLLRLPFFNELTIEMQQQVCDALCEMKF